MNECKSLVDNVDEFKKLIQDLENMSIEMDDADQTAILLNSYSKPYENFVDTLKYGRQTIKLEEIDIITKDKENRSNGNTDVEGHMVRGRTEKKQWKRNGKRNSRSRSKSKPRDRKCYYRHKEGHFRRDYLERQNKKRQGNESENGDADVVEQLAFEVELTGKMFEQNDDQLQVSIHSMNNSDQVVE
ncbi:hypothetical protein ACOSQ2_009990 [Xanthoceras sorbifolium]